MRCPEIVKEAMSFGKIDRLLAGATNKHNMLLGKLTRRKMLSKFYNPGKTEKLIAHAAKKGKQLKTLSTGRHKALMKGVN